MIEKLGGSPDGICLIFKQVYDFESIMHYGTRFFSKNDGKTIQAKEIGKTVDDQVIGKSYYKFNGPVLSKQDILETNLLYKCTKITGKHRLFFGPYLKAVSADETGIF